MTSGKKLRAGLRWRASCPTVAPDVMKSSLTFHGPGRIVSLHLHPATAGEPLADAIELELVMDKGIIGDERYFGRLNREGQPSRRQVTLIEREQLGEHAAALGLTEIPPGAVRANIETAGIDLVALIGGEIDVGTARLRFYAPRDPCAKMDAICAGLRERMLDSRQGVLAEVVRSGVVRIGDAVRPSEPERHPEPDI